MNFISLTTTLIEAGNTLGKSTGIFFHIVTWHRPSHSHAQELSRTRIKPIHGSSAPAIRGR